MGHKRKILLVSCLVLFCFLTLNNVFAESFTYNEMTSSAEDVAKSTLDTSKILKSVTINNKTATDENYLNMLTHTVVKVSNGTKSSVTIPNRGAAPSPSGVAGGTLTKSQYLTMAKNINDFYSSNGRAPNYATINGKNVRYESLVYGYAKVLYYYNRDGVLPAEMSFPLVSAVSTSGITVDTTPPSTSKNLADGSYNTVKTVILTASDNKDSNPKIYYTINGGSTLSATKTVSITLNQGTTTIKYYAKDNKTNTESTKTATYKIDLTAPSVSNSLPEGYYVNNTSVVLAATDNMDTAPTLYYRINNNGWVSVSKTVNIILNQFENNISYYGKDNVGNTGPTVMVTYFTYNDQILKAANSVKLYVEANHTLPATVLVNGQSISISKFLKGMVEVVLTISNGSRFSTVSFENILDSQFNQTENSVKGIISDEEYIAIAEYIKNFTENNGYCPDTVNTTLGTVNFESLVYMYSNLLVTYDVSSNSVYEYIDFIPWVAVSNPDKFYNFNSQKIFNDLQSAINDLNTSNGDVIYVGKGIFVGNFFVNKEIAIKSLFGNSTFTAMNPNQPVFSILSNFVEISDLNIKGSTGSSAISISRLNNITISGNNITNNAVGIDSSYSNSLMIFNNIIANNNEGISSTFGNDLNICWNTIINNSQGISLTFIDNGVSIVSNTITNNVLGIELAYSHGSVNFNAILNNSQHGLESLFSNINATNNWWGSNTLTVSSNTGSHIYKFSGDVTHDSWLVLKTSIERDFTQSSDTTGVYIVTGDLTYNNQGQDTYDEGNLPDDLAIKFSTTRGTINATAFTSRGKAKSVLKITNDGLTNITSSSGVQNALYSGTLNVSVLGVYNNRTNKYFTSIQSAINDATTLAGDTLLLANGIFTENIIINKKISIKAINTGKVFISAFDFEKSVFTINSGGSGSTIQGLVISEAYDAYGIFLNSASSCNILNNTIYDNDYGIFLHKSNNNIISGNNIYDTNYGIYLENSTNNQLLKNDIKNIPNYAIYLENFTQNVISLNNISNSYIGVYLKNSSYNNISTNKIIDNYYALYISESNGLNITNNTLKTNWVGIYLYNSSGEIVENSINYSNYGICLYDSIFNIIEVNFTNTTEILMKINTTGIIMAGFSFECGPAALATAFKNLGIHTPLDELIELSRTDVGGTSMYGLIQAAREKGLIAKGVFSSANQLKKNNIAFLMINGEGHFVVITDIINNMVYLADSSLGNINMTMEKFLEIYTGKAIILTNTVDDPNLNNVLEITDDELYESIGKWGKSIGDSGLIISKVTVKKARTKYATVGFSVKPAYKISVVGFKAGVCYQPTSGYRKTVWGYGVALSFYLGNKQSFLFRTPYLKYYVYVYAAGSGRRW